MKKKILIFLILFFLSTNLGSFDFVDDTTYTSSIDWKQGNVNLTFLTDVKDVSRNREIAFYLAEESSSLSYLKKYITNSIMKIRVDSNLYLNQIDYISLKNILDMQLMIQDAIKSSSRPSMSMDSVTLNYNIPIYPYISSFLVENENRIPLKDNLAWRPVQDYTGLIIYAKDPSPVHGKVYKSHLRPAMFPKIYDEDMNTVLSKKDVKKDFLVKWGTVAYNDNFDEEKFRDRIGDNPLKISMIGIYGKNNTDIIIPNEYAQKLSYNENNHNIISEGKILVIIREDEIYEKLQ